MSLGNGESISIPSPIDVHVHLRQPGGEDKETIRSGTVAALLGGYQAVFDMPNNPAPYQTWTEAKLDEKIEIAAVDAHTNVGFYAGVNLENPALGEIPALIRKSAGLKLYMGHTTGNNVEYDLEAARPVIDSWISASKDYGQTPPILLHAREGIGEEAARYIASQEYPVHWCHIASETEVQYARELTRSFPKFYTGGVTPHHLTMTERNADFQQGWNGARMQPPLGTETDAEALLRAYNDEDIQILETDHAPHAKADKLKAEAENPTGKTDVYCTTCYGISGIEFVLPIMISLVRRNKITMERLVDSLYDQPVRMLRLTPPRGVAQTELIINPRIIGEEDVVGKSRNNPYLGWVAGAKVVSVTINGWKRLSNEGTLDAARRARILRAGSRV